MDEKTRENNRLRQRKFLELHKDEVNSKRRERYHERISKGKCPRCGGRVKKGHTLCTNCCDYMLDLNRKYAQQKKTAAKATVKAKAAKKKPKAKIAEKV
jgi:predicted nucleic acid-binding Zn ribbon protein